MTRSRLVLAAALVVGAALFVVGTRGEHHTEPAATAVTTTTAHAEASSGEGSSGETTKEHAAESAVGESAASHGAETGTEKSEKILGVNLESTGSVVAVVVASVVLVGLVLARRSRDVLLAAIIFCALATLADIAELTRQLDRSNQGLAFVAALVAAAHLIGAVAGVGGLRLGVAGTSAATNFETAV